MSTTSLLANFWLQTFNNKRKVKKLSLTMQAICNSLLEGSYDLLLIQKNGLDTINCFKAMCFSLIVSLERELWSWLMLYFWLFDLHR